MDLMNRHFGLQLRQELVALMDSPGLLRPRVPSTGSHRLSSDSTDQLDEDSVPMSDEYLDMVYAKEL